MFVNEDGHFRLLLDTPKHPQLGLSPSTLCGGADNFGGHLHPWFSPFFFVFDAMVDPIQVIPLVERSTLATCSDLLVNSLKPLTQAKKNF